MADQDTSYQDRLIVWLQLHLRALLLLGVGLSLIAMVVFYWYQYRNNYFETASRAYRDVVALMQKHRYGSGDDIELLEHIEAMEENFPDMVSTQYVILMKARLAVERADYEEATEILDGLLQHDIGKDIHAFTVLHKARILLNTGELTAALTLLDNTESDFASPAYDELRGDIYAAARHWRSAYTQYESAIKMYSDASSSLTPPLALLLKIQVIGNLAQLQAQQQAQ